MSGAVLLTIQENIQQMLKHLADLLWGDWLLLFLMGIGFLYTIKTRFVQITRIAGGPGALFWMWVAAAFGMATKFGEIVLGMRYRDTGENGAYIGGPMYYISKAFHTPSIGTLTAILLFIQNAGGTLIQSNVISGVAKSGLGSPLLLTAIIVASFMIIIIHGGLQRLTAVQQKLVPLMAALYIAGGLIVVFSHIAYLPHVIEEIFRGAFTFRAGVSGIGGAAIRYGVARGLYSNEAGEGSAAVIHSAALNASPVEQGLYGLLEVFVDTMVICSCTGFSILCSGVSLKRADANTLAAEAFASVSEPLRYVVYTSLLLFAFTSLMSQWIFGQASLHYLNWKKGKTFYKIFFPAAILIGSMTTIDVVWSIQDCALGLLIIPNLASLAVLSDQVKEMTRQYFRKKP